MQLEAWFFRGVILHFIMHGVDVTAQNVEHAYSVIRHVCDHCGSMQFPLQAQYHQCATLPLESTHNY